MELGVDLLPFSKLQREFEIFTAADGIRFLYGERSEPFAERSLQAIWFGSELDLSALSLFARIVFYGVVCLVAGVILVFGT